MRHITWLVASLAIATAAVAQEPPSEHILTESTVGVGGLICDTQEEVREFIALQESKNAGNREVDGCGVLTRPMRFRVVMVGTHKTEMANYLLVRYDFLDLPIPPQFGIGARKDNGTGI